MTVEQHQWNELPHHGTRTPAAGRGVLEGAFALLEELSRLGEARLTDLAVNTGLSKSTVHRLLSQLSALGAVEQFQGRHRVGSTIVRMGPSRHHHLLSRASDLPLRQLMASTGATVCVVAPSAVGLTVVHGIPGAVSEHFPFLRGQTLPPDSAADVVFAAFAQPTEPAPAHSTAQWKRRLNRARELGAEIHEYEGDARHACLAIPVHASSGQVVAAVGVGVPDTRRLPAAVASARRAAHTLGANLQRLHRDRLL
ncbi:helix-turn-helix domain-containing protein [Streptomyces sp. NPDC021093]|uniref:helix-turn-helix domain-containing protein n=1 Tax=Streptomyces sp. NPDC021093 TaxID=3365112 RepID=UPI00379BFC0E